MKALYELQCLIPGNGEERNIDAWTLVLMLICEQSLPVLAILCLIRSYPLTDGGFHRNFLSSPFRYTPKYVFVSINLV